MVFTLEYTSVHQYGLKILISNKYMFRMLTPDIHDNSKLLKIHNFIKNTMNIYLTALNECKDVEIYLQKHRKSLQKYSFSWSCFLLFPPNFKLTIVFDNNMDQAT